jgi:nitrite reductase/ring-hydroxylating ferredoxin subunit
MVKPIDGWETFVKTSELPLRSIDHVKNEGKETAVINLDGKYYAIYDRCEDMKAPLSKGEIRNVQGNDIVTSVALQLDFFNHMLSYEFH